MIKLIIKQFIFGVACGSIIFAMLGILQDLGITNLIIMPNFFINFTAHALGFMAIGVAFSISSIVYNFDTLALWLKVAINVFIGLGTAVLVGFLLGVVSLESPTVIVFAVVANIFVAIAIAIGSYLLNDREAKRLNATLRKREAKENIGK
jgi:hypothetical protein